MEKKNKNSKFNYFPVKVLNSLAVGVIIAIISCSINYVIKKDKNKSQLENLADINRDGILSFYERSKMYEMCGVADKPSTYVLTQEDINRGIANYKEINIRSNNPFNNL